MRRKSMLRWVILITALLAAAWPGRAMVSATTPRAGSSDWTGTFTFTMSENYTPSDKSSTVTANCSASVTRNADRTASATATYSSHETRTSGSEVAGNLFTTTLDVPSTTVSFPQYMSVPDFELRGDGTYYVSATPPSVMVTETETTQTQGSAAHTSTFQTGASCDPAGGEHGTAQLKQGTTETGSETNTLLNGTKITMEWTIQDSTLVLSSPTTQPTKTAKPAPQPTMAKKDSKLPTGKIKVTNNGIDASLSWMGWEIGYSGDWKASQPKAGSAPKVTSPDGKVQVTLQQPPASSSTAKPGAPPPAPPTTAAPTTQARTTITQIGKSIGPIKSISFKPFAIGTLTGQIGIISLGNSGDSLLITVVGGGTNQIVTETLIKPGSSPLDLVEAGIAIGSLRQTS